MRSKKKGTLNPSDSFYFDSGVNKKVIDFKHAAQIKFFASLIYGNSFVDIQAAILSSMAQPNLTSG